MTHNGKSLGLALGGGASRGLAHLGVLAELRDAEIAIDVIAGTSVGALVGALICGGVPLDTLIEMAPRVSWLSLARPVQPKRGFLGLDRLERWVTMMIGERTFADLDKPLAVVATDLDCGERVIINQGPVGPAVCASCSVPFFFEPVQIGERMLVDGGIIDNVPVRAARELGADFVIASDVFEPDYKRPFGPLGSGLAAIETLVRHAGGGVNDADFLIQPQLADQSYVRLTQCLDAIGRGRHAARSNIHSLLRALETA
ncbi:MAG: patatin-like phospholipase family protein [Candidatus Promineifilaceae bacterium]|nr:patatin-like phospholipase family protein [Candidatus Promineifilaceae bacterium]